MNIQGSEYTRIVLFFVFGIVLGWVIEFLLRTFHLPIPYTVLVFYTGILLSVIGDALHVTTGNYFEESTVSADLIVYLFLPALLFAEAMNLNWHHVRQAFNQSVLLAGPGAIIVAMQIAGCAYAFLPFKWPLIICFLFGAILCPTDTVSVLNLLKETHASSKLTTIIAGESLLNDGSAMILYLFVNNMIVRDYTITAARLLTFVAEMLILSPLIGFAFGFVTYRIMRRLTRPTHLNMDFQIAVTFLCAYGSFYVAQAKLEVSGVLACVTAGLTLSIFVSPLLLSHEKMHEVWHTVEWICNTLLFLLAGLIGGRHTTTITVENVGYLLLFYFILNFGRGMMIFMLLPIINRVGLTVTFNEALFATYSGLRGVLAIALSLTASSELDNDDTDTLIGKEIFFMVTGLVSMTLLFNASTGGWVLLELGLVDDPKKPPSKQKQQVLDRVRTFVSRLVREEVESIKKELGEYNPREVARLCKSMPTNYGDISTLTDSVLDADDDALRNSDLMNMSHRASGSMEVDNDLLAYTRTTFLDVMKARYWESIETGKIGSSASAAKLLLYSLDVAHDFVKTGLEDWTCIERALKTSPYLLKLLQFMDDACYLVRYYPGWVSWLDAKTERIAIYTLINYIDAHEYAQSQLHEFLGGPRGVDEFDIAGPEESQVRKESELLVDKAKFLLRTIKHEDVVTLYTHRAAKIITIKQSEILDRMIKGGALSDKNAHYLFQTIQADHDRINIERATYDRGFVKDTKKRKIQEEKQLRDSLRLSSQSTVSAANTATTEMSNTHNNTNNNNISSNQFTNRSSFRANLTAGVSNIVTRNSMSSQKLNNNDNTSSSSPLTFDRNSIVSLNNDTIRQSQHQMNNNSNNSNNVTSNNNDVISNPLNRSYNEENDEM